MSRALAALAIAATLATGCRSAAGGTIPSAGAADTAAPIADRAPVKGTLLVSRYGAGATGRPATTHRTTFVPGPSYRGMEDNDIRGHLDGTFKWGWNQPTQVHVRVGRRGTAPRYGEFELFRVLQRWDDLALPPGARVTRAELAIRVEGRNPRPLRLLLYRVRKDWDPGTGGTLGNNNSPPKRAEVWWNDVAYGVRPWGLPGAGFAADGDPEADTDLAPLAEAEYAPGDSVIVFASPELTAYAAERVAASAPLLLLLKLSDYQEDIPGALLNLYSANHGDSRNLARRPRLTLEWESPAEIATERIPVFLEYGRTLRRRLAPAGGEWVAATFVPDSEHPAPVIELRAAADSVHGWQRLERPIRGDAGSLELRIRAATDPVPLGTSFTADLRDTWVRTAAPEEQVVRWTFISPTGARHTRDARYAGEYRWTVEFAPDEPGPWRYWWTQQFDETPYRSADGVFDVVLDDTDPAAQVAAFVRRLAADSAALRADTARLNRERVAFSRLERAALQLQTPASFRSAEGERLRRELRAARAILGEPVPDSLPLVPDPGADWERSRAKRTAAARR